MSRNPIARHVAKLGHHVVPDRRNKLMAIIHQGEVYYDDRLTRGQAKRLPHKQADEGSNPSPATTTNQGD